MSNDQAINTALWNFCMRANDGPHRGAGPQPAEGEEGAVATTQADSPLPPRDPKDLEWLKTVMESLEMPDKQMKRLLKQLHRLDADSTPKVNLDEKKIQPGSAQKPAEQKKSEEPEETMSNDEIIDMLLDGVLDEINDCVEDLNFAKEFELMKGCEVVLYKLDGPSAKAEAELRTQLLLIIAHASQNLPDLQESFSKLQWARQLVPMLKEETNAAAAAANIMACSSMCRGSAKASGEFVNAGGFDALHTILSRSVAQIEAGNKDKVEVKPCLRGIRLLHYFVLGKVSSTQILEKVAMLTLPLVPLGEETPAQEDLRKTATEYLMTFFKVLGGNEQMQVAAKKMCREKLTAGLEQLGEANWPEDMKQMVALFKE